MNRSAAIKLAASLPQGDSLRRDLLARVIGAKEHATEEAREKYLKEHPDADPKNHTVKKQKSKKAPKAPSYRVEVTAPSEDDTEPFSYTAPAQELFDDQFGEDHPARDLIRDLKPGQSKKTPDGWTVRRVKN